MPVPHMPLFAQLCERAIDFVPGNRAVLDINEMMRIPPEETNHAVLRVHSDAIAIRVMPRRRDNRPHGNILQFADSLKGVTHLSPFDCKLKLIIDMLISAATASAEIWALRRDAIRGTLLNFEQLCFGELFLFPDNFRRNKLVLHRVRNKNGFALFPRDAFSAEGDVFDFQINNAHTMQIRSINIQAAEKFP